MSYWLKLYQDTHADARLRKTRARAIWPWILCRLKDGDGFATDADLDPWRASDDHDEVFSEAEAAGMIERLKSAGLLVSTDCGWACPDWERHVGDPTNAERQRRFKERKRAQEQSNEMVTPGNSYRPLLTLGNGGNGRAEQSRAEHEGSSDACAHVHTHEEMPPQAAPTDTAPTPDLEAIVREWMATQNGRSPDRQAAIAPWNVTVSVKALVDKHGPQKVREAIKAATLKTNQGAPSLAFLTRLLDEGIHDPARPRQPQAGTYQQAAYKSANGVATPRHVPEGEI